MLRRKVGGTWFAAETESDLSCAIDCAERGEPMLGSKMRVRGTSFEGKVVLIDIERRVARLKGSTRSVPWTDLEYV